MPGPDAQGVAIRAARPQDVPRLVEIEQAAFATDIISARSFRRRMNSPTQALLVATLDGVVHGYALLALRRAVRHARIYSLAVDIGKGRGLGRRLIEACETLAVARGYRLMRLEVNENNARAIGIYERAGYVRVGRRESYYEDGATALVYEKRLEKGWE